MLPGILLLVGILVASALITNWFARTMYNHCEACGTLNAKRRTHCRTCQKALR